MRIEEKRFSVPFCILEEPMPPGALRLILYLFSIADFSGKCRPGYKMMKKGAHIGSECTVKKSLDYLQKSGWIIFRRSGGSNSATLILDVPARFRKKDIPLNVHRLRSQHFTK